MKFAEIKAAVFDMDGVLWRGDNPLPGLIELFQWLDEAEIPYALATNNASKSLADYERKLAALGLGHIPSERVLTSAIATATLMQERFGPGTSVYVFGEQGLKDTLADAGYDVDGDEPEVVVAGLNRDVTYEMLKQATLHIRNGAEFIGTNPDTTFPAPEGQVPGAGSMIAALEAASGRRATIIGKPELPMFQMALKVVDQPSDATLMVGDRLNTDIAGGQAAGMKTALLFTGVTHPDDLTNPQNDCWPDVAFDGLPELLQAWAGHDWYKAKMKERRLAGKA